MTQKREADNNDLNENAPKRLKDSEDNLNNEQDTNQTNLDMKTDSDNDDNMYITENDLSITTSINNNNYQPAQVIAMELTELSINNEALEAEDDSNFESKIDFLDQKQLDHYLIEAVRKNQYELVQKLIKKGADVGAQDNVKNELPFHYACKKGNINLINLAINQGIDVNIKNDIERTLLHVACIKGYIDIVSTLLKEGANMEAKDIEGWTPLYDACENGHHEIVKLLIERGAKIELENNEGVRPLHLACKGGNLDIVNLLIERGANLDAKPEDNSTLLHYASRAKSCEVAKFFIEKGVDVNVTNNDGITPLHSALIVTRDNLKVINFLIKNSAAISAQDKAQNTPLHYAVGCAFDDNGNQKSNVEAINLLIKLGADVNAKNKDQTTPLHFACREGSVEIIKLLIDKDADVNIPDKNNCAPLQSVFNIGNIPCAIYLLSQGAPLIEQRKDEFALLKDVAANPQTNSNFVKYLQGIEKATSQERFQVYRLLDHLNNISKKVPFGTLEEQQKACAFQKQCQTLKEKIGQDSYKQAYVENKSLLGVIEQEIDDKTLVKQVKIFLKQMLVNYKQIATEGFIKDKNELIIFNHEFKKCFNEAQVAQELIERKKIVDAKLFFHMGLCKERENAGDLKIFPKEIFAKIFSHLPTAKNCKNDTPHGLFKGEAWVVKEHIDEFLNNLTQDLVEVGVDSGHID
jgi:ankyrin repeat protein